jgi:ELWxxDGT repeat protein
MYLLALLCVFCTAVKSQFIQKVTEVNYWGSNGLYASEITAFNNKLYFFGTDDNYVNKLMTSDGISPTVAAIKQIDSATQYPNLRNLIVLNNLLVFNNVTQLWKSDGTAGGTSVIKTIRTPAFTAQFVVLNNVIYFPGDSTNTNPAVDQLWKTDGTPGGTTLVKTINPSGAASIGNMYVYGGRIYFYAYDGTGNGVQPWVSDGTADGTKQLKVVKSTVYGDAAPSNFTPYNGKLYFSMNDDSSARQLWVTDGTTDGTLKVTRLNVGNGLGLYPSGLTVFNSRLFFSGYDKNGFNQLWSTDGTDSGTVIIKADSSRRNGNVGFCPNSIVVYNNMLYMAGFDSLAGTQLWASDGTPSGTTRVTNVRFFGPSKLYPFQNKMIMTGYDSVTHAVEVFASDGTAGGTVCPTPPSSGVDAMYPWQAWVPFNNSLYYRAAYGYFGDYQLCRYTETQPSGVAVSGKELPGNFALYQNYPNPFNPSTNIGYTIASSKEQVAGSMKQVGMERVRLAVYDLLGREVAVLVDGYQTPGEHHVMFDARSLASGVYFYRLVSGGSVQTRKMTFVR